MDIRAEAQREIEEYHGYKLNMYPPNNESTIQRNTYQTFKPRPYDDTDYYWAYSYDKMHWMFVYKGQHMRYFIGTFEQMIDKLESYNEKNISQNGS